MPPAPQAEPRKCSSSGLLTVDVDTTLPPSPSPGIYVLRAVFGFSPVTYVSANAVLGNVCPTGNGYCDVDDLSFTFAAGEWCSHLMCCVGFGFFSAWVGGQSSLDVVSVPLVPEGTFM